MGVAYPDFFILESWQLCLQVPSSALAALGTQHPRALWSGAKRDSAILKCSGAPNVSKPCMTSVCMAFHQGCGNYRSKVINYNYNYFKFLLLNYNFNYQLHLWELITTNLLAITYNYITSPPKDKWSCNRAHKVCNLVLIQACALELTLYQSGLWPKLLANYRYAITITITITADGVMITANYNYQLQLPQHCFPYYLVSTIFRVHSIFMRQKFSEKVGGGPEVVVGWGE